MNRKFRVEYIVKTTASNRSEFSLNSQKSNYIIYSVSDDLNEIFTDLFDLHRFEGIIGIEILNVQQQKEEEVIDEVYSLLSV